jgi:hypothetical protein
MIYDLFFKKPLTSIFTSVQIVLFAFDVSQAIFDDNGNIFYFLIDFNIKLPQIFNDLVECDSHLLFQLAYYDRYACIWSQK